MSTRGAKAVFGVVLVVFGAAVFLFASAYLIARGQPRWLAGAVGALAFPVLPVAWHVIGERRRRARIAAAKTPPKTSLSPGDRYVLRAVAVAAVVLGPMFAIGRFEVVRAAWSHKLWFIPGPHVDPIESAEDMLAHMPASADAVLLIREHEGKKQGGADKVGVIAYGSGQLAMIAPRDPADKEHEAETLEGLDEQRKKIPFVTIDPLETVALGNDVTGIATEKWKPLIRVAGTGPRQAIRTELAKAPKDAILTLAYVPAVSTDGIEKITGWVLQAGVNEKLTVEADITTTSVAAAEKAIERARAGWKQERAKLPGKCHATLDKIADAAKLERTGTTIKLRAPVQPDQMVEVMFCGMQNAKPD
jgi:hypothetical protein